MAQPAKPTSDQALLLQQWRGLERDYECSISGTMILPPDQRNAGIKAVYNRMQQFVQKHPTAGFEMPELYVAKDMPDMWNFLKTIGVTPENAQEKNLLNPKNFYRLAQPKTPPKDKV